MRRIPAVLAAAAATIALLAVPATAGETAVVSPPKIFKKDLAKVKQDSSIEDV